MGLFMEDTRKIKPCGCSSFWRLVIYSTYSVVIRGDDPVTFVCFREDGIVTGDRAGLLKRGLEMRLIQYSKWC
jgi:hypothetical protein